MPKQTLKFESKLYLKLSLKKKKQTPPKFNCYKTKNFKLQLQMSLQTETKCQIKPFHSKRP